MGNACERLPLAKRLSLKALKALFINVGVINVGVLKVGAHKLLGTCGLALGIFGLLTAVTPDDSYAASLADSLTERSGISIAGINDGSYDGPEYNAFQPLSGFTGPNLLSVDSFTGGSSDQNLEFFLLSEAACFSGLDATFSNAFANEFGVVDAGGNFVSVIDSLPNGPVSSGTIVQGKDEELTLALKSPEGLFTTDDASNPDGAAHILASQVTKSGTLSVPNATLLGTSIIFDLQVGDLVLYIEDLLAKGNVTNFIPDLGDFDYNDMVIVVRSTPVPEPSSLLLLLLGGLALFMRRRGLQQS